MTSSKHDVISRMFHSHTLASLNKELKELMDDKAEEKSDAVREAWVTGAKSSPSAPSSAATKPQPTSKNKAEMDSLFGTMSDDDKEDEDHAVSEGEQIDAGHVARV